MASPFILIASASDDRGQALSSVVAGTGFESMVLSEVEALLYHTRGSVPAAFIMERALVAKVPQLDLTARRQSRTLPNSGAGRL